MEPTLDEFLKFCAKHEFRPTPMQRDFAEAMMRGDRVVVIRGRRAGGWRQFSESLEAFLIACRPTCDHRAPDGERCARPIDHSGWCRSASGANWNVAIVGEGPKR